MKNSFPTTHQIAPPSAVASAFAGAKMDMDNRIERSGRHVMSGAIFPGAVDDAYIAGSFGETFEVNKDAMKKTILSSTECLDTLAFYVDAVNYFKSLVAGIDSAGSRATKNDKVAGMILDERLPVMISSAVSRMICMLLRSAPHEMQTHDGKKTTVITFEDFYTFLVKNFSNNVVLYEKGSVDVASKNIELNKYELEVVMNKLIAPSPASGGFTGLQTWVRNFSAPAFIVDAANVGNTFFTNDFYGTATAKSLDFQIYEAVLGYLKALKKFNLVASSDTISDAQAAFAAVLTPIVCHVFAFTYVQPFDYMFKAYDATNSGKADDYTGVVFHRAMAYPSLVSVMKMYGIPEQAVDEAVHALQMRVVEVRKLFQKARDAYDEKPKTMRVHESEVAPSSYLQSDAERLNSQKVYNKMIRKGTAVTATGGGFEDNVPAGLYKDPLATGGTLPSDEVIAGKTADMYANLRDYGIKASMFGRKKRRARRSASFGKKRRSGAGKKRRSASFGKKRRASRRR